MYFCKGAAFSFLAANIVSAASNWMGYYISDDPTCSDKLGVAGFAKLKPNATCPYVDQCVRGANKTYYERTICNQSPSEYSVQLLKPSSTPYVVVSYYDSVNCAEDTLSSVVFVPGDGQCHSGQYGTMLIDENGSFTLKDYEGASCNSSQTPKTEVVKITDINWCRQLGFTGGTRITYVGGPNCKLANGKTCPYVVNGISSYVPPTSSSRKNTRFSYAPFVTALLGGFLLL